jgi:rhamnulokinase
LNSIAIDLGAESGRVFLGRLKPGALSIEEIHRFPNRPIQSGAALRWDVRHIWEEIRTALLSPSLPKIASIGVDAWGVDYALLDERGELLENPHHYRDPRNPPAMDATLQVASKEEIYRETGVQFMPINTLYQLYAAKLANPELLASARRMIMIPDLFHYWMSGNAVCEFTAASTTQFLNPATRDWSRALLDRLGLPSQLPARIVEPGTILGTEQSTGAQVIAPASHDTASAVAAISASGDTAFLSSGTWSLVGIELAAPVISPEAMRMNFTNEGGVAGTTRLLKNVMGLWLLQGCRKRWSEQGRDFTHDELIEAATHAKPLQHAIDPDDASFLNPADMLAAIDQFCRETQQPIPDSRGAYTRAILESLARKYALVIHDLETLIGRTIKNVRVVGGGSKNALLNQLTANATGKRVLAGPVEASVLGNLGLQFVALGELKSIAELRHAVDQSFPIQIYDPQL